MFLISNLTKLPSRRLTRTLSFTVRFGRYYLLECDGTKLNVCVIAGKHEERTDQHGFISREFSRRVAIPKGVNPESVTSTLTADGHLTIMAPKLSIKGGK